jgi:hypothetical protein
MNNTGLRKLRYSAGARRICESYGRRVLNRANRTLPEGDGYRMTSEAGAPRPQGRWQVRVIAVTPHAKYSDRKHNTLIRALNGG